GDKVKTFEGKEIKTYQDLLTALREKKVGDKVKLTVEREGKALDVEVTLEARPAAPPVGGEPTAQAASEGIGGLRPSPNRPCGAPLGGQIENAQDRQGPDGFQTGGIYKSTDGGESWTRINSLNPRPFYFSQIRVDPSDDKYLYVLGLVLHRSSDGGKTFRGD